MDNTRFLLIKTEKNLFEYPTLILLFLNYPFFLRDVVLRVNIFETNKVSPQKKKIVPNTAHFTEIFLEKKIFKLTLYFVFFLIIFSLKTNWPFIWTNFNSLLSRLIWLKLDQWRRSKMWKVSTTTTAYNGEILIRKIHMRFLLRWAEND